MEIMEESRKITVNKGMAFGKDQFPDNSLSTARFTVFSFIPKTLFLLFHNIIILWLVISTSTQALFSDRSGVFVLYNICILLATCTLFMLKEATREWKRRLHDRKVNGRETKVWNPETKRFMSTSWQSLRVGNVVLLSNERVPADMFLLTSSNDEATCYVKSSSIDGQVSMHSKKGIHDLSKFLEGHKPRHAMKYFFYFDNSLFSSEMPNANIYAFKGKFKLQTVPRYYDVSISNLLLRETCIKKTKWTIGLVLYTGRETKAWQNAQPGKQGLSTLEKKINLYSVLLISVVGLFALAFTGSEISYLFFLQYLIPIHLYGVLCLLRICQCKFIEWDIRMQDRGCYVLDSSKNEDLGQTEYIFTDKTGTITDSHFIFKKCCIDSKVYGNTRLHNNVPLINYYKDFVFYDKELIEDLSKVKVHEFFECLSLCHTVKVAHKGSSLSYHATSSDEEALVIAAHCMGFSFYGKSYEHYIVQIQEERREYQIVGINHFDSKRRRMSIVFIPEHGLPVLLCKGADCEMLSRCRGPEETSQVVAEFSQEGLRTLIVARRFLTLSEVHEFEKRYSVAVHSLYNRDKLLEEVADEMEVDMEVLGITAIEDKIQEDVGDTVELFKQAGIKMWMLTGDKEDIAISSAYSSKIISPCMELLYLDNDCNTETLKQVLKSHTTSHMVRNRSLLDSLKEDEMPEVETSKENDLVTKTVDRFEELITVNNPDRLRLGLVLSGESLVKIAQELESLKTFIMISCLCESVVIYRASALQKSLAVKMIREYVDFKPITLAVGDGVNDLAMLGEAHISVGIRGPEGLQAASLSAYNLSKFKDLAPLLLVHGRWNYFRSCKVLFLTLYKNWVFVLAAVWFSFMCDFSGTSPYVPYLLFDFNIVITTLPLLVIGTQDKDERAVTLMEKPELYNKNIVQPLLKVTRIIKFWMMAFFDSSIVAVCLWQFPSIIDESGHTFNLDLLRVVCLCALIGIITITFFCNMNEWNLIFITVNLLCYASVYVYLAVFEAVDYHGDPYYNIYSMLSVVCNLAHLFCVLVSLSVKSIFMKIESKKRVRNLSEQYLPEDTEHIRSLFRLKQFKNNLKSTFAESNFHKKLRRSSTRILQSILKVHSSELLLTLILFLVLIASMLGKSVYYSSHLSTANYIFLLGSCFISEFSIFLICAKVAWKQQNDRREQVVLVKNISDQFQKSQQILSNLLPVFVKDRVKSGIRYIAEEKKEVTVMFCDIYNFDKISSSHKPNELIELLDQFFSLLDRMCNKHGVTKIETVNKTYMVCGGLEDMEKFLTPNLKCISHGERCIDMALSIVRAIEKVCLLNGDRFHVKIGIHSGPVIAGVVGNHKPQFSLVGDTVNTASRMCSTIKTPGKIQISASTFELIQTNKYVLETNSVFAKGKGQLKTYFVSEVNSPRLGDSTHAFTNSFNSSTQNEIGFQEVEAFDISKHSEFLSDYSDLPLAGPVQYVECVLDEFPQNRFFRLSEIKENLSMYIYGQWAAMGIYALSWAIETIQFLQGWSVELLLYLLFQVFMTVVLGVFAANYKKWKELNIFCWIVLMIYMPILYICAVGLNYAIKDLLFVLLLKGMCMVMMLSYLTGVTFGFILLASFLYLGFCFERINHPSISTLARIGNLCFLLIFLSFNLLYKYISEKRSRENYNLKLKSDREIENTDQLLKQMIPIHVLNNMKQGITKTDKHKEATILYADITGFTAWSAGQSPIGVITMLSKLFCKFDKLCVKHGVYKVHTIGDCYVVLGFNDTEDRNPPKECYNVINMAQEIIKVIGLVNKKYDTQFAMRIGVHTGSIIAGITGTNIVRYDIYGIDNDIANLMESEGTPGRVNISEDTMNLLSTNYPEMFLFQPNKPVIYNTTQRIVESYFLINK